MFGGILIKSLSLDSTAKEIFTQEPYAYFFVRLKPAETLELRELKSFCLYVKRLSQPSSFRINGRAHELSEGDVIEGDNVRLSLESSEGPCELLVAGTKTPEIQETRLKIQPSAEIYKVTKPWGHELWFHKGSSEYSFKKVFIKAGNKTSLQYHKIKRETCILLQGQARLHYKSNAGVDNDKVTAADIDHVDLQPVVVLDVFPNTLHRIEAREDVAHFEVSTPHLDDVIRVQDDTARGDGRIAQEHETT